MTESTLSVLLLNLIYKFIYYYAAVLLMAVMSQPVLLCGIMSNGHSRLNV